MSTLTQTPDTAPAGDKLIAVPTLTAGAQVATGLNRNQTLRAARRRFRATRALNTDNTDFRLFRVY